MKKNISINISGIIFHVEEDGYELLKNYLESISRYFSTYEDSKEITDDIESRIAEIFLGKLSNSKQVITREDVDAVIKTMGSVEDFAAAEVLEEDTAYRSSYSRSTTDEGHDYAEDETYGKKRLYRDTERKVLGGVAAGIAHYFKIDPLWIRLLILVFFFADAFASFGTITLVTYIVLWIVLPGNPSLEQDRKLKKLFRNPDDKVIGGVSGGIAAYFGTDPTVIRLLFVLSIFLGGTGLLIYIVLWIITPEAKTITDKMQMKGEPVTLSNIESSIKKNFSVDESGEESLLLKIILFPFRLVAVVINALGQALGPLLNVLGDLARVFAGLILLLIGFGVVFSLLVASGILLGLSSFDPVTLVDGEVPLRLLQESLPATAGVFGVIALLIPALALMMAGIAIIARRKLVNSTVGWSALGVWFIALIGLSVTVPQVVLDFKEEGQYATTNTFDMAGATAVLTLGDYPDDQSFAKPRLMIRGHADSLVALEKEFEARGRNRKAAIEYAQMVSYEVQHNDSVLVFPPVYSFNEDAKFRDQEVELTLYMPYGQAFMMDRDLRLILRNTLYRSGYSVTDMDDNTFMFTEEGLQCLSCEERPEMDDELGMSGQDEPNGTADNFSQVFELGAFRNLDINGPFRVNVEPGDDFGVQVVGSEARLNDVEVENRNGTLEIRFERVLNTYEGDLIEINVIMPEVQDLNLRSNAQLNLSNVRIDALNIELGGSSQGFLDVDADRISLNMVGASSLKLFGQSRQLDATMNGAARLEALDLQVRNASLETSGAAQAQVYVTEELNADAEDTSRIRYQGNPNINLGSGSEGRVSQVEPS
jgi:phage shock protein PspC (stress-responsive transcriptional regulator)